MESSEKTSETTSNVLETILNYPSAFVGVANGPSPFLATSSSSPSNHLKRRVSWREDAQLEQVRTFQTIPELKSSSIAKPIGDRKIFIATEILETARPISPTYLDSNIGNDGGVEDQSHKRAKIVDSTVQMTSLWTPYSTSSPGSGLDAPRHPLAVSDSDGISFGHIARYSSASFAAPGSPANQVPKAPEGIIRKLLCPHRHHGCLFEANQKESIAHHLQTQCLYEKLKDYISSKEEQISDLKKQLVQMKKDTQFKVNLLEQQLFQMNSNVIQTMVKLDKEDQTAPSSAPNFVDPKYLHLPFKLNTRLIGSYEGHQQLITSLAFHDDILLSGSGDASQRGCLRCWRATPRGSEVPPLQLIRSIDNLGIVSALLVSAPRLFVGSMNVIKLFDLESFEHLYTLEGHKGEVKALVVSGNNTLLSGAVDGLLKVWQLDDLRCIFTLNAHEDQIRAIQTISTGGSLEVVFTASEDKTIKMWNPKNSFSLVHVFRGHVGPVRAAVLIGDFIVSGAEDNMIKIWNWRTKEEEDTLSGVPFVTALKTGKAGDDRDIFFSGHANGLVLIWDFRSRELLQLIEAHKDRVRAITGFQDSLVTASYDKTIKVWK
eukprot:TRINITY_DN2645_c0_g1_i1.p1 TRINITY_DN2645_c0_g1~~TRINITY_DN2645_c0_g1_i1.p1  ORF type:complete len:602 (-),score=137.00 TRINITY_DN2645_c0_g1_i1:65-1870(-)